jgi:hypothetical protein
MNYKSNDSGMIFILCEFEFYVSVKFSNTSNHPSGSFFGVMFSKWPIEYFSLHQEKDTWMNNSLTVSSVSFTHNETTRFWI